MIGPVQVQLFVLFSYVYGLKIVNLMYQNSTVVYRSFVSGNGGGVGKGGSKGRATVKYRTEKRISLDLYPLLRNRTSKEEFV